MWMEGSAEPCEGEQAAEARMPASRQIWKGYQDVQLGEGLLQKPMGPAEHHQIFNTLSACELWGLHQDCLNDPTSKLLGRQGGSGLVE